MFTAREVTQRITIAGLPLLLTQPLALFGMNVENVDLSILADADLNAQRHTLENQLVRIENAVTRIGSFNQGVS